MGLARTWIRPGLLPLITSSLKPGLIQRCIVNKHIALDFLRSFMLEPTCIAFTMNVNVRVDSAMCLSTKKPLFESRPNHIMVILLSFTREFVWLELILLRLYPSNGHVCISMLNVMLSMGNVTQARTSEQWFYCTYENEQRDIFSYWYGLPSCFLDTVKQKQE